MESKSSHHHKKILAAAQNVKAKDYWLRRFSGGVSPVTIPADFSPVPDADSVDPDPDNREFSHLTFSLPPSLSPGVLRLGGGSDAAAHLILLAGLGILLYKQTGQEDIILGVPVYLDGGEGDVEFINRVLPIRFVVSSSQSFRQLLVLLKETVAEAVEQQNYPVEVLAEQLGLRSSARGFPLFDIGLLMESIHDLRSFSDIPLNLVFRFNRVEDRINGVVDFNDRLFKKETVTSAVNRLVRILEQAVADVNRAVGGIETVSAGEREELLFRFNDTSLPFPDDLTILELFEHQVEKTTDRLAVIHLDRSLSYGELNRRSNRLGNFLRESGLSRGDVGGLLVDHSLEMIHGIMGILKSGACYLPLETRLPTNRIAGMLRDSGAPLVLSRGAAAADHSLSLLAGLGEPCAEPQLTASREPVDNLDEFPVPDRSLINYDLYRDYIGLTMFKNVFSLQASRGCPFHCAYCHKIWPKRQVMRSAVHIFAEVKACYDAGVRRFAFIDDIFNLDRRESGDFFRLVIESGLDIQLFFPNGFRGDILTTDYIDLAVEAGTVNMALSLETASPRLQELIGKKIDIEKLRHNISYICRNHPQIILELQTMLGFPSESEQEARLTLDFVKEQKWIHFPYVHLLKIYPNTQMARLAEEHGVSAAAVERSSHLAYHEMPDTLPFSREFVSRYQSEFLNDYFLNRERLKAVLPFQLSLLTEDELVQKYDSYLPVRIGRLRDMYRLAGLSEKEVENVEVRSRELAEDSGGIRGRGGDYRFSPDLTANLMKTSGLGDGAKGGEKLRVLLLDLSQFFRHSEEMLYDVVEPPLGLMYILTFLQEQYGSLVRGKICKSRIDFGSFEELRRIVEDFCPHVIGVRSLSYYKDFFHHGVSLLKHWFPKVPIVAGGPYATSDYRSVLRDGNVDAVVLGEGEVTFSRLIGAMLERDGVFPERSLLCEISGLALGTGGEGRRLLWLDYLEGRLLDRPDCNPPLVNSPCDPAYVLFTSGSTGIPKGVVIEHRALHNLCAWHCSQYGVSEHDRASKYAGFGFDASVWEIFPYLLSGSCLCVVSEDDRLDMDRLVAFFRRYQVSIGFLPTQICEGFMNELGGEPIGLRALLTGGDKLREYADCDFVLWNNYGPTENTVVATSFRVDRAWDNIPIGHPINNSGVLILDRDNNLQPVGLAGELCIWGCSLARGYLNLVEQTHAGFGDHPFNAAERLYRTGDLARWLPGGIVEFLGRVDQQLKVRGNRVELGEIESVLRGFEDLTDAVVSAHRQEDGGVVLCGYVVLPEGGTYDEDALRAYLSYHLPDYMVPGFLMRIDRVPLTANGKIDRAALPVPRTDKGADFMAARSELEKQLADVWAGVLGRKRVGVNDNFFLLGGDSIKSIQIASRMNKLGYKVEVRDLFRYPTIAQLGSNLKRLDRVADQGPVTGEVQLTPIQHEFFDRVAESRRHHFNQSVLLYSEERLEIETLRRLFKKLQEHHDALRMSYSFDADRVVQSNNGADYPLLVEEFDYRFLIQEEAVSKMEQEAQALQESVNLERGPLLRVGLFHLPDRDRLLMVIHHLVIDGVSWRILFEDLEALYRQHREGREFELPLKSDSFKVWSEKLSAYSADRLFLRQKSYWREVESRMPVDFEVDFPGGRNRECDADGRSFLLDETETEQLLTAVSRAYGTEINDILLCGLGLALRECFAGDRFAVFLEGHGREEILGDVDIKRTVGWFTSVFPVVLPVSGHWDLSRQIREIKEVLHRVPDRGIGYGILRYLTPREYTQDVDFCDRRFISFNYLGQFNAEMSGMSHFGMAGESRGSSQAADLPRDYELEVSGIVGGSRLSITVHYSRERFTPERMTAFLTSYRNILVEIIHHCLAVPEPIATPVDLTYPELDIETLDRLNAEYGVEDIYPLSPMQEQMLFHWLYDRRDRAYFQQLSFRLNGPLEVDLVEQSMGLLCERHQVLRTSFLYEKEEHPLQVVRQAGTWGVEFTHRDIRDREDGSQELMAVKESDLSRGFDLGKDPLMRLSVFRVGDESYEFVWSFHHILMDGWCFGILVSEYQHIYGCLSTGREVELPVVEPYSTYISWLREQDRGTALAYWEDYLRDYNQGVEVPAKKPGVGDGSSAYSFNEVSVLLSPAQSAGLSDYAARLEVTLNTLMQCIWGVMLGRYNGCGDVVFGVVVSGRPSEVKGIEMMVGLFLNTVPVRLRLDDGDLFSKLSVRQQREMLEGESYHYVPLAEIQSASLLKQSLIDHIMVFENYPMGGGGAADEKVSSDPGDGSPGLSHVSGHEQTNYDLNVIVCPGERLLLKFEYNRNRYDRSGLERMAGHFERLVERLLAGERVAIGSVDLVPEAERRQLVYECNNNRREFWQDRTVAGVFADYVEQNGDVSALVCGDHHWSRTELYRRSGVIAGRLACGGIGSNSLVGVMLERSPEMVAGILGVWRLGGGYIPLSLESPVKRRLSILADSGAEAVLIGSGDSVSDEFSASFQGRIFRLDDSPPPARFEAGDTNRYMGNVSYVIYTSGSTGRPKGAMVEFVGMMNHLGGKVNDLCLDGGSVVSQNASHTFDISVWQFFAALLVGGRTVIYPQGAVLEADRLMSRVMRDCVTILEVVPSYLSVMLDCLDDSMVEGITFRSLRYLLVTGEEVKPELLRRWFSRYPGIKVVNAYGPTEASDDITHHEMAGAVADERVPIGRSLQNLNIYIVDNRGRLCPFGVKGEIWVSGVGVGRGYLNEVEKTAAVFSLDPFYVEEGPARLYRTGDVGCMRSDGTVEFFGRIDHQVKVRGFRIEPGEIEKVLLGLGDVKEAVVLLDDDRQLRAFVVPERSCEVSTLRDYLSRELPPYMVPDRFTVLSSLPLTPNGKIDRQALRRLEDDSGVLPFVNRALLSTLGELDQESGIIEEDESIRDDEEAVAMSAAEREQVLLGFNATAADVGEEDVTIPALLAGRAARSSDRSALRGVCRYTDMEDAAEKRGTLSYRRLDLDSDRLARRLHEYGVKTGDVVGVLADRTLDLPVCLLAILKAGGAYLPLDADYPPERIGFILQDSGARLVLADGLGAESAGDWRCRGVEVVDITALSADDEDRRDESAAAELGPADAAYVMYTSGSTGLPKGVLIEHGNVVNFIAGILDVVEVDEGDRILSLITVSFDIFVLESFLPLSLGCTVVLGGRGEQSESRLALAAAEGERVSVLQVTPSLLQLITTVAYWWVRLEGVKNLLVGGEVFPEVLYSQVRRHLDCAVYNLYGPTETTVWSSMKRVDDAGGLNIGRPLRNTGIYILGTDDDVLGVNGDGELCIGGLGVGRGYLNRPELTSQRFVNNRFGLETGNGLSVSGGSRMYRTGDLARWTQDGELDFIGRRDYQVKIHGIRVELGEIESVLQGIDGVDEAVVVYRGMGVPGNGRKLCAFLVCAPDLSDQSLRSYAAGELPGYMVPGYFVRLEQMPLTPNGKVDRVRLGRLDLSGILTQPKAGAGVEPADELEREVREIFSDVLQFENSPVDLDANFFEVGGHSLRATMLTARLYKRFGIKVPLPVFFGSPTVRGIASYIRRGGGVDLKAGEGIEAIERREYYPLSSAQRRLYVLQQMEPSSTAYNLPRLVHIRLDLDQRFLEEVFKKLIARHESLRTGFELIDDQPVQRVYRDIDFGMEYYGRVDDVEWLMGDFVRSFNLAEAPLLRVGLVNMSDGMKFEYLLLVDMHHIITDGVSNDLFVRDFMELYFSRSLPPLRVQYKDYASWQQGKKDEIVSQQSYWVAQFSDEIPVLDLPTDYPRPPVQSFAGGYLEFEIGTVEASGLRELARGSGGTLFMVLLSMFNVFLSKLNGQEDIVIGTPVAGRRHADVEPIIGMFVNTLALRNFPAADKPFSRFLQEVRDGSVSAFDNQDYPFEELVERVAVRRDTSRNPLFDVMLVMDHLDIPAGSVKESSTPNEAVPYSYDHRVAKFDLVLTVLALNDRLVCRLTYCSKLFGEESIRRFIDYIKRLTFTILQDPGMRLADIEIIGDDERQDLLYRFNRTEAPYPENSTVHRLVAERARHRADAVALQKNDESITYGELQVVTGSRAKLLRDRGVGPGQIVGIMLERSFDMVIGILSILKAGAAYLPLDIESPPERTDYMLADSGARILICRNSRIAHLDFRGERLDVQESIQGMAESDGLTEQIGGPEELAYIIYTSGSTGRPKGVAVQHRSVVNLLMSQIHFFDMDEEERVLLFAAVTFDASVEQIFASLVCGGTLVSVEKEIIMEPRRFEEHILLHRITHLHAVPPFLNHLKQTGWRGNRYIKRILSGGDICPPQLATGWNENIRFFNRYGPTESTVTSIEWRLDREAADSVTEWRSVPIGRPINNSYIYILDPRGKCVPIGITGEMYIGGAGLGRGYINQVEQSAASFPLNPFRPGERWYRTGDLARRRPDGNIEFCGRVDLQVKIRGFRIELEEIARHLVDYQGIREAVVKVFGDTGEDRFLAAYLALETSSSAENLDINELKAFLARKLPDYMIPSQFVLMDDFPLTTSGKIDRRSLPVPRVRTKNIEFYEAPRNEVEVRLIDIWARVLNLEKEEIGINADFFDLGGHSLNATLMVNAVQHEMGRRVALIEVFKYNTIRKLSDRIRGTKDKALAVWENIFVLLKDGSDEAKNLFLIHEVSGQIESYIEFCHHLPLDFNCWAIRADREEFYFPGKFFMEELARKYVQAVKRLQPSGPYYIIGWSLGGVVAFEMARQFEQLDDEIGFLALFDTTAPPRWMMGNRNKFVLRRERKWILKRLPVIGIGEELEEELREELEKLTAPHQIWPMILEFLDAHGIGLELIREALHDDDKRLIPDYDLLDLRRLLNYLNMGRTIETAAMFYIPPGKVAAPLHYIAAGEEENPRRAGRRWKRLARLPLKFYISEGDHVSMMKEPQVIDLARLVSDLLEQQSDG